MITIYNILRDASRLLLGRSWGGLLSILALCAMMTSCVNNLPYDAEIGAPKLVLNALLQPDSTLTATVSRTAHFLDTEEPQRLSDATVTAMVGGVEYSFAYDDSTQSYRSTYTLRADDKVTLTATHSIGTATATAQVMKPTSLVMRESTTQPFTAPADPLTLAILNDVDSAMLMSIYIDDPADETNYYRLTVDYYATYLARYPEWFYGDAPADSSEENYTLHQEYFYPHYLLTESSSRLVTESESASQLIGGLLYLTSSNSIIFSDERLRSVGEPIVDFLMLRELPRSSADMYNPESGWGYDDGLGNIFVFPSDTVSGATYHYDFMLETLSEDYYRYLSTVSTYEGIGNLVSEPVRIHSNVSTGVGIVGSYSTTTLGDSLAIKY